MTRRQEEQGLKMLLMAFAVAACCTVEARKTSRKPHIIIMLADDMGWNDVGFHGSNQIPTPNIDALAYNGLILNSHYTPALCTPSRAALMTGKYPIHLGMQHLVILEAEPWGLPLEEKMLPQYLKESGYATHAIGKWHLGFFRKEYTPTHRGFDSHFGYWQGFQDYYDHSVKATFAKYHGYDMRRNMSLDWSAQGKYSTDLFTDEAVRIINTHEREDPLFLYMAHLAPHTANTYEPFQAPDEEVVRFAHIEDPERRTYAAMVSKLDQSVGEVVSALRSRDMLDNSIIIFMSDNGAPTYGLHSNRGSNYPLRGIKETPYEGGVRGVAAVWSPLIKKRSRVANQLMHIADWLPTLHSAAGLESSLPKDLDGVDMWKALSEDLPSPRTELLHNIDDIGEVYSALRSGPWKYVKGSVSKGRTDSWYGESGRSNNLTDDEVRSYDVTAVLHSKAGAALGGFVTKQQIKTKEMRLNAINSVAANANYDFPKFEDELRLLTARGVLALRAAAEVRCNESMAPRECDATKSACLFNIAADPCERTNLAAAEPDLVRILEERVAELRKTARAPLNKPSDPLADPHNWNDTWTNWHDALDQLNQVQVTPPKPDLKVVVLFAAVVAVLCVLGLILAVKFVAPYALVPSDQYSSPRKFRSFTFGLKRETEDFQKGSVVT
nr:PREDICTED: arylsulfatase B-like isoform X2 [Bemisia tabaci]